MVALEYVYIMYPAKAIFRTGEIVRGLGKRDNLSSDPLNPGKAKHRACVLNPSVVHSHTEMGGRQWRLSGCSQESWPGIHKVDQQRPV